MARRAYDQRSAALRREAVEVSRLAHRFTTASASAVRWALLDNLLELHNYKWAPHHPLDSEQLSRIRASLPPTCAFRTVKRASRGPYACPHREIIHVKSEFESHTQALNLAIHATCTCKDAPRARAVYASRDRSAAAAVRMQKRPRARAREIRNHDAGRCMTVE
jgi:hypothetical protein